MDGIDAILEDEAHRKRTLRVSKFRDLMLPFTNPDIYTHCQDDCRECTIRIQENFIKNRRVPQTVDLEDFKIIL